MFQVHFKDKRYSVEFRHAEDYEHEHGKGMTACEIKIEDSIFGVIAQTFCSSSDMWCYAKGEKESLRKALVLLGVAREVRVVFWSEYFLVHDRLRQSRKGQKADREQARKDAVALEKLKRYCAKHSSYFSLTYYGHGAAEIELAIPVENEPSIIPLAPGDTISEAVEAVFRAIEEGR